MAGREPQQLSSKEAGLFRQVVKLYESKQYKKGIKAADQILKKHPDHGETLAMKGLILCYQEKKAEAYDFVRRGLRADLKSHVCWHVYGLLWRSDNNYEEAIKCYKNALRIDKENLQILRDLAQLQIQMRDYSGFIDTRQTLLHLKAAARNNWISFAIAHHMNKNYDLAVQILSAFESTQEVIPKGEEYEHSEMLFYKVMILEEGGRIQEALQQLKLSDEAMKDRLGFEESRGRLLLKNKSLKEAEAVYRKLLHLNPDNHSYHDGLRESLGLPLMAGPGKPHPEHLQQLKQLYSELKETYPRSSTALRVPLDFLEGPEFEDALDAYIRPFLIKGIPSLFSDLKGLYRDKDKVRAVERKFQWLLEGLRKDSSVLPLQNATQVQDEQQPAGRAAFWAKLFLARHYDRLGSPSQALELLEEESEDIEADEEIEVLIARSKVLKHAGDLEGAAAAAVKAQNLDLADRYLNSVAAKALFRAGCRERAERMAARFTKDSDQPNLLYEMQCMWYETECGSAFLRKKDYGRALKNFIAVVKHFATFQEDQFDFHSYCIRKMTLRSYISMLRMEDRILETGYYAKAVWGAVDTYIELAKGPAQEKQSLGEEEARLAGMSLEEQKKYKIMRKKLSASRIIIQETQKRVKEENRKTKEAAVAAAAAREKEGGKQGKKKQLAERAREKDPDPDGEKLAATKEPLTEAAKLLQSLRDISGDKLRTHLLSFEVAMQRHKRLLALQAVKRAIALAGKSHADVHRVIVRFCKDHPQSCSAQNGGIEDAGQPEAQVVQDVISSQVKEVLEGKSLASYHAHYVTSIPSPSLAQKAAALEAQLLLHPHEGRHRLSDFVSEDGLVGEELSFLPSAELLCTEPNEQEGFRTPHATVVLDISACTPGSTASSLEEAVDVHQMLEERLSEPEAAEQWAAKCRKAFPHSSYFGGPSRTPVKDLEILFDTASNGQTTPSVLRAQQLQ